MTAAPLTSEPPPAAIRNVEVSRVLTTRLVSMRSRDPAQAVPFPTMVLMN